MKKQRLKNEPTDCVYRACASVCFFSPDWLVGLLRCCGGGVFWFLILTFFFVFLKRHRVPPNPPLIFLKQVPPPFQEDKTSAWRLIC